MLTGMTRVYASPGFWNSAFTAHRLPFASARVQLHEDGLSVWIGKAGGGQCSTGCECRMWHSTVQIQLAVVGNQQTFHAPWRKTLHCSHESLARSLLEDRWL